MKRYKIVFTIILIIVIFGLWIWSENGMLSNM
jgi:hypothetical protein